MARFDLEYFKRGVIGAYITSPGGTKSSVLNYRAFDALVGDKKYENVTTVSVHFWGEQSNGIWTVSLRNDYSSQGTGSGEQKNSNFIARISDKVVIALALIIIINRTK